jgi:phosphodiesterase/alkaline phosphatase D-like protein
MMKRRDLIKLLASVGVTWSWLQPRSTSAQSNAAAQFDSTWHDWPDMLWAGPECWGNRLQDWRTVGGQVECLIAARNRTLHCLTHQLSATVAPFEVQVTLTRAAPEATATALVGFRLGAKGPHDDYRSAAVYGTGLDIGLSNDGRLQIGTRRADVPVVHTGPLRLQLAAVPRGGAYQLTLSATDVATTRLLGRFVVDDIPADTLVGNVALLSHVDVTEANAEPVATAQFAAWRIAGEKVVANPANTFGPVCFAQYTVHRGVLKLTAQLTPIEHIAKHRIVVEVRDGNTWRVVAEPELDPLSRTAHARVEHWDATRSHPYRVRVELPVGGIATSYSYEGTIAREPIDRNTAKVACFSCNADHGFPDADVVTHVLPHQADAAVFLGDQFYESHGGFGIQRAPLEKSSLDYLRKWYMFGWSYRDLFRHIPSVMMPDDHDVYHGNIWGEGGIVAPTDAGWGYVAQDQGGYKMAAEWVNIVQRAQTSHLPDAHDPTPVAQGIGVYYGHWNYAGVSFAVLEDRKFKSAPSRVLPPEVKVANGFVTSGNFDHMQHRLHPNAQLLGARQEQFLNAWSDDWSHETSFKVVLSQTSFCAANTLPVGSTSDEAVPSLAVPPLGEYVAGDAPAGDMDTNGWPQDRRDAAVRALRKARAFHIAGDQHLASVIQYGVNEFADAGFVFTGPALNNIWPRRWWPQVPAGHTPIPGQPPYTGNYLDAFGNHMTVHAVANPRRTGLTPAIIHDRVTGYGMVVFDKTARTIRIECWPRSVDPVKHPNGQYAGWPVTIREVNGRWIRE